jgi:predicted nucleotidyltransferase
MFPIVMKRADVIRLIREHLEDLHRFHVRAMSLFGSVARDEARPDSDVDVLVDFDGDPTFEDYVGLSLFLEELLGRRVDVLTRDGIKPRVRPLIERDLLRVA